MPPRSALSDSAAPVTRPPAIGPMRQRWGREGHAARDLTDQAGALLLLGVGQRLAANRVLPVEALGKLRIDHSRDGAGGIQPLQLLGRISDTLDEAEKLAGGPVGGSGLNRSIGAHGRGRAGRLSGGLGLGRNAHLPANGRLHDSGIGSVRKLKDGPVVQLGFHGH
jgi:hypothetical protein